MSIENHSAGYRIGYARVSTLEQDEALQRDALTGAGCQRISTDKASGKLEHRPALDAMRQHLRVGDTVVVWRLDRLGRSLRHLIDTLQGLEGQGVAFLSLTESIDTSTPRGQAGVPRLRGAGRVRARPHP
jgi:DNA invertase Pin-like site-specific DNA recombinase